MRSAFILQASESSRYRPDNASGFSSTTAVGRIILQRPWPDQIMAGQDHGETTFASRMFFPLPTRRRQGPKQYPNSRDARIAPPSPLPKGRGSG
ncbi:hypothetical protein SBV1_1190025 [Verrucomicrobia bacterium]|nr:hypothetical protein SBV1_1190025 [Verrucomicrobiota bacterium]